MKVQINFWNGKKSLEIEAISREEAIIKLINSGANLSGANLSGANLSYANLSYADLSGANLSGANLSYADLRNADLSGADLRNADLSGADLRNADLSYANLSGANLSGANLSGANLSGANLSYANLRNADLSGANLSGANLSDANLSYANLSGARNLHFQICPEEGGFYAWKKTNKGIIKIYIPANAKRTSCIKSRKCRAEFIKVVSGCGCGGSSPTNNNKLIYNKNQIVKADSYNGDPREECTHGIHFFMTKKEAEQW